MQIIINLLYQNNQSIIGKRTYLTIVEDKKLCEEAEAKIQSVKVRQVVMPDVSTPKKIKAFQKSKNLEQTGKIGPKTRLALWRIKHGIDD